MSTELAVITNPDEIANLPTEQRGQLITRALVESKQWLAVATKGTDPTPIAEFKAWAATVAEMTKQKGLAEDIQLDALEMVRRAERGIGVAIRNGQEAGTIAKRGDIGSSGAPGVSGGLPGSSRGEHLDHPSNYFNGGGAQFETYAMTDDVSDDVFEDAVSEARQEGNLGRRNIVRKIKKSPGPAEPLSRRLEEIADLANNGASSRQIAKKLGGTPERVREVARLNEIDIRADRIVGKTHLIDPERVVRETVFALEGLRHGLDLIGPSDLDGVPTAQVKEWLSSLSESLRCVRQLVKELNQRV